ncbi:MAG: hypothetical protein AAGA03_12865 [Planctomycetota bacterium]
MNRTSLLCIPAFLSLVVIQSAAAETRDPTEPSDLIRSRLAIVDEGPVAAGPSSLLRPISPISPLPPLDLKAVVLRDDDHGAALVQSQLPGSTKPRHHWITLSHPRSHSRPTTQVAGVLLTIIDFDRSSITLKRQDNGALILID